MKKTLVILFAGLLLVAMTACNNDGGADTETKADTSIQFPVGTDVEIVTNEEGEPVTDENGDIVYVPSTNETEAPDNVSESNPTITDVQKTICVWVESTANVRSSTVIESGNIIGSVKEGDTLTATGESANWYRIDFHGKVGYVAKTVAGDTAILATFNDVTPEEIEISHDGVNVRSFPSTAGGDYSVRARLNEGDKVIRVAVGDGWSRIQYEIVSETETDANGQPAKVIKEYYVSNDYIKGEKATTATTEAATEAATEVATETATEVVTEASTEAAKN